MTTTFKSLLLGATAALAIASGAVAADRNQLAASAGVSPAEAAQLTLTEIAAIKFNQDVSGGDRQKVRIEPGHSNGQPWQLAAAAGISAEEASTLTLSEIAGRFFNKGADRDDQQTVRVGGGESGVVVATRQQLSPGARQLAASAGLTAEEAQGLSLRQIAAHAFNQSESSQDRQRTDLH